MKNLFSVFLGLFLLGGINITFTNTLGLVVNSVGGVWYSVIKYKESQQKHRNALQHDAMEKGKLLSESKDEEPDGETKSNGGNIDNNNNNNNNHNDNNGTQHIQHFLVSPDKGRVSVT